MTHQRGFTLLELLVGLVVLGFVLAGIGQGVFFGLRVWDDQARDIAASVDLDAADRTLRNLVAAMDPGAVSDEPAISAGATRLAFDATLSRAVASLGVDEAQVAVLVDGGSLVLRWTPAVHAVRLGPPPPSTTTALLPGVDRVEFAYWGDAGLWQVNWTERNLPTLVRIHLVFPPGSRRHWPDIVAATARRKPR